MSAIHNATFQSGRIAWYVTGRFYTDANGKSFDAGYFPDIKGISGAFFSDKDTQDETTAHFTFCADKFEGTTITNGDVTMGISPPGNWHLYLNDTPAGDFTDPHSFAKGKRVATFHREGTTGGMAIRSESVGVLTFALLKSKKFTFRGNDYDLQDFIPDGVTQIGYGSTSLQPGLPKYPEIKCFAATALTVG